MVFKEKKVTLSHDGAPPALRTAIIALAVFFATHALAQSTPDATTTIERTSVGAQADREASPYKTREGRLAAKPLDWNSTIGKKTAPAKPAKPAAERAHKTERGAEKGGDPAPGARQEAQRLYPDEWRRSAGATPDRAGVSSGNDNVRFIRTAGSADVFSQYQEGPPSMDVGARQEKIGKLFLNGGFCSASVVSPNGVIVTAAHCCYDRTGNKWIGGWTFSPAYNSGNTPFGNFDWSSATVLTSWISNGDIPSDVCLIKLSNDSAGHSVSYYVGWLGRSWNWPSDQELHSAGYPGNIGGGNTLEVCTAESFSPSSSCGGGNILNMGCSMTFGSSGGPWIRHYRTDDWVNAVVHGYDGASCTGTFGQTFNGPRFTSANIVTLCTKVGC
jgi:V8-like Glu-specific endopeptidase